MQVIFFDGKIGAGKITSWDGCEADALKRESFWLKREIWFKKLEVC